MKRLINIATGLASLLLISASCADSGERGQAEVVSKKKERNFIKNGTDLYRQKRYAEAEVSYNKALGENPDNKVAKFNLASAYIKQRGEDSENKGDSLMSRANSMLAELSADAEPGIAQPAFYDRGNLAYKGEDYSSAVEHYKNALRRNPADDAARENLRLAQLKLQQQQQNQNQQNKDDDKNQDQQQQQNQQQNKDDQKQQDQQNQNQQQNEANQNKDKKEQPQQQNGGLSDANAQQILKAMEDKENATRQKLEKMKQGKAGQASRRQPEKPW